jgi:MoaA/NifB/PqqE/SkfB family radical SAM enzyme
MNREVIDTAINDFSNIQSVTFTGGEPGLAVARVEWFIEEVRSTQTPVGYFYVATNGLNFDKRLAMALVDLYEYCDDKAMCMLVKSHTQYHGSIEIPPMMPALTFFNAEEKGEIPYGRLWYEGRAKENQLVDDTRVIRPCTFVCYKEDDILSVGEGEIYINARGDVIPGCDFSYKRANKLKMGNILKKPLADIILESKYCRLEED